MQRVFLLGENIVLHGIFTFIVDTAAGFLAGVLLLRFWMQAVRIRAPASIAQFIFTLSDWLVLPLRRLLPGIGGLDWASMVGAFLVALASAAIEMLLLSTFPLPIVFLSAVLQLVQWIFYGFMGLLIIEAIFSWVNPNAPLAPFVRALNDPLMRPLRRVIPPIANIDLTPIIALIALQVALQLVRVFIAALV